MYQILQWEKVIIQHLAKEDGFNQCLDEKPNQNLAFSDGLSHVCCFLDGSAEIVLPQVKESSDRFRSFRIALVSFVISVGKTVSVGSDMLKTVCGVLLITTFTPLSAESEKLISTLR